MYGVTIQELIDKMKMKNVTPEIDVEKIVLTHPDVNRPALQLAGFFDHFDKDRVQIIGLYLYYNTCTVHVPTCMLIIFHKGILPAGLL